MALFYQSCLKGDPGYKCVHCFITSVNNMVTNSKDSLYLLLSVSPLIHLLSVSTTKVINWQPRSTNLVINVLSVSITMSTSMTIENLQFITVVNSDGEKTLELNISAIFWKNSKWLYYSHWRERRRRSVKGTWGQNSHVCVPLKGFKVPRQYQRLQWRKW